MGSAVGFCAPLLRLATVLLGCVAILWGTFAFPIFWREAPLERIAQRVIFQENFKLDALLERAPAVEIVEAEAPCRPIALHSAAVIRLRLVEQTISIGETTEIDDRLDALKHSVVDALSCSPADSFLWLVLFWVENTRNGFSPDNLKYLRMSYELGPNEGWIILKRNGIALALYEQLPPDLAETAVDEFVRLLSNGFVRDASTIFTGPGWRIRNILLPKLKSVAEGTREAFARTVYDDGYDVDVPGVLRPDQRQHH